MGWGFLGTCFGLAGGIYFDFSVILIFSCSLSETHMQNGLWGFSLLVWLFSPLTIQAGGRDPFYFDFHPQGSHRGIPKSTMADGAKRMGRGTPTHSSFSAALNRY